MSKPHHKLIFEINVKNNLYLPMANIQKISARKKAAELMALNPNITAQEIASKLNIHTQTVSNLRKDPNFVDMVYSIYMVEFGAEIPAVLQAMIREAKSGNVQAGRLVLEHSGKLVKNINITVDSPFEKFLKAEETEVEFMDAEIQDVVDDIPDIPDVVLPERKIEEQEERKESEYRTIVKEIRKDNRKQGINSMYHWKKRARAVGVDVLPGGRPTKATKEAWMQKIRDKEREK